MAGNDNKGWQSREEIAEIFFGKIFPGTVIAAIREANAAAYEKAVRDFFVASRAAGETWPSGNAELHYTRARCQQLDDEERAEAAAAKAVEATRIRNAGVNLAKGALLDGRQPGYLTMKFLEYDPKADTMCMLDDEEAYTLNFFAFRETRDSELLEVGVYTIDPDVARRLKTDSEQIAFAASSKNVEVILPLVSRETVLAIISKGPSTLLDEYNRYCRQVHSDAMNYLDTYPLDRKQPLDPVSGYRAALSLIFRLCGKELGNAEKARYMPEIEAYENRLKDMPKTEK